MNWLTEYERTGDTKWLDKIKAGMRTQLQLAATPCGLLGAGSFGPPTGQFMPGGRGGGPSDFDLLFGATEGKMPGLSWAFGGVWRLSFADNQIAL